MVKIQRIFLFFYFIDIFYFIDTFYFTDKFYFTQWKKRSREKFAQMKIFLLQVEEIFIVFSFANNLSLV